MQRVVVTLDEDLSQRLTAAAEHAGKSRSAYARELIAKNFANRFPEWWFENLGTWEDDRSPEEILADIRSGTEQREREPLD